jgi:pimeloyl-ACP methyl ester carboxylesterase
MPHCRYKEEKIFYAEAGKGRAVVLLHGFLETAAIWNFQAMELSKKYRVILIDLPGHGQSDCFGYIHSMEEMAGAVKAVLHHLQIRKSVMIGHSMGGYVALAFAELFPDDLRGLVLFHSTALADSEQKSKDRIRAIRVVKRNKEKFISEAITKLFHPDFEAIEKGKKYLFKMAEKNSIQGIVAALEGMRKRKNREVVIRFGSFNSFFIAGKGDLLIPFESVKNQVKDSENAGFYELSNSGHLGMIEEPQTSLKYIEQAIRLSYQTKKHD